MRNSEKINRFFNKVNQEFFICKRHLISCESVAQASAVSNWASNLNEKWDNELNNLVKGMRSADTTTIITT